MEAQRVNINNLKMVWISCFNVVLNQCRILKLKLKITDERRFESELNKIQISVNFKTYHLEPIAPTSQLAYRQVDAIGSLLVPKCPLRGATIFVRN